MKSSTCITVALVLLLCVTIASTLDMANAEQQQSLYCEMTAIYKETNGQYGWPEYKENVKCQ